MPPIRARTLLARLGARLHRAPATRRRRLVPLLACFALVLGAVQFGTAAQPAFAAASSQACYDNPSAANCDGATIDVGVFSNDLCFNDSYSLTYKYGYTGANFTWSDPIDIGWTFETWLDYSPICKSNFTYTEVTHIGAGVYQVRNKIRRAPGPDGGYLMEEGPFQYVVLGEVIGSPMVYSPDNAAQSCLSTTSNDQVACTTGGPNNNGYY